MQCMLAWQLFSKHLVTVYPSLTTSGANNNRKAPLVSPTFHIPPMAMATSSLYSPSAAATSPPQPPVAAT